MLWNTRYQNAALEQLRRDGPDVHDDDVRRLSPLGNDHINVLGRYRFSATDLTTGRSARYATPQCPTPDEAIECLVLQPHLR